MIEMRLIDALSISAKAPAEAPPFRVALLCGFTAQPLSTFLGAQLQQMMPNRRVEIREGRFGDLPGNLERYLSTPPGPAALVLEWADLDTRLGWRQQGGWGRSQAPDIAAHVETQLGRLYGLLEGAASAGLIVISLPTLPVPPVIPVAGWQADALTLRLQAAVFQFAASLADFGHIRFINTARLDEDSPVAGRADVKRSLQAGAPYQLPHASALGAAIARAIHPPPPKKGLITDLDNTLWAGILGEEGVDGVHWDLEHHAAQHGAYQQMVRSLAESGVLVAIASKNEESLVMEALHRPDLLIGPSDFFPVEAHWGAKSESVFKIIEAWNIAADSVVFIDDSPMELAEVQAAHTALIGLQFPADPGAVAALVRELADLFGKPFHSEEDALRSQSIRSGAVLHKSVASAGSQEEILAGASGVLTLSMLTPPLEPRALELVNKTNQFNLNGRRYNEAEWLADLNDPSAVACIASYKDRFGSLGKVSVLAGKLESGVLSLNVFVLSCRAFARRIEYAMLDTMFRRYDLQAVEFQFAPTERNAPLRDLLRQLGNCEPSSALLLSKEDFETRKLPHFMRVE